MSHRNHKAVTYSIIGIDDILNPAKPFRRFAFLPKEANPAESLKRQHRPSDVLIHDIVDARDPTLASRFWYVYYMKQPSTNNHAVLATEKILLFLDQGLTVWGISGPFKTEDEAYHDAELHWETGE